MGAIVGALGSALGVLLAVLLIWAFTHFVRGSDDLPLFAAEPVVASGPGPVRARVSAVETRMREVLPDELTPKEALALVYELRGLVKE